MTDESLYLTGQQRDELAAFITAKLQEYVAQRPGTPEGRVPLFAVMLMNSDEGQLAYFSNAPRSTVAVMMNATMHSWMVDEELISNKANVH